MEFREFYIEKNVMHATIAFNEDEVNDIFKWAYNELLYSLSVPGFRRGHIPYEIFKNYVDKDKFINKILTKIYSDALNLLSEKKEKLNLIDLPRVEKVDNPVEGKPYELKLIAEIYPKVSLPDFEEKELEINVGKDKETIVKEKINAILNANSTLVEKDGSPEIGDYAVIEYYPEGKDGAIGRKETSLIELGKEEFFPEIDKELLNMKEGEEKIIIRKLDDGSDLPIHIKIISFKKKILPDLTDEFIKSIGYNDSLEQFIEEKNKEALDEIEKEKKDEELNSLINYLVENSEIDDIPERLIDTYIDEEVDSFEQNLLESALSMDEFLEKTKKNLSSLRDDFKPKALKRAQLELILREVIIKEPKLSNIDEEEINKKVSEIMGKYKDRELDEEKIKDWMRNEIAKQKALDFLLNKVKFKFNKEKINK